MRGYVVAVEGGDATDLKPIAAVSGRQSVFDPALLETLRWASQYYVSPLSAMLERAAPPNNPPAAPRRAAGAPEPGGPGIGEVVEAALARRVQRPTLVLAGRPPLGLIGETATRLLSHGRSTMVVAATTDESEAIFEAMSEHAPGRAVIAHGDMPAADVTGAWARATAPGVVVGTPRVASWPVADLGMAVVVEDGRRAMKDRQTPTVHARDLLRRRALVERFGLVLTGPVPTSEILATGPSVLRPEPGRLWPHVEVVDRRRESTGGGVLTDPAKRALGAVTKAGGRSFVFGHRRGYAAATRCVACRAIRLCPVCGSRPDPGTACSRCGSPLGPCGECGMDRFEPLGAGVGRVIAEVGRVVGSQRVSADGDAQVTVGTERDVVGMSEQDLAVIPDFDGLLFGTNYRAGEDALRIGARIAGVVGRGSGRRLLVQTSDPEHAVVRALVKADPESGIRAEMEARVDMGYPPAGEVMVIEVTGAETVDLGELDDLCEVHGPAERGDGHRWLLLAADLTKAKTALRPLVQRWRDSGMRVRVDVDPIDL